MLNYRSTNLKPVKEFCCLGDIVSEESDAIPASSVNGNFPDVEMAANLLRKFIELITRNHFYAACLRPVLMYCFETRAQTKTKSRSINSFDMNYLYK